MKILLVLSPGRCGTTRLASLLRARLPAGYAVIHQVPWSRAANVAGHWILAWAGTRGDRLRRPLYRAFLARYAGARGLVCCDPLSAMLAPADFARRPEVRVLHLTRDPGAFARSMLAWSRSRWKSRLAHLLIPGWQPGLRPLEALSRERALAAYRRAARIKQAYFRRRFGSAPGYLRLSLEELYAGDRLRALVRDFLGEDIEITDADLARKENRAGPGEGP